MTTEARAPRTCAAQQEKPQQGEARAPQWRVAPAHRNYRKPACSNENPTQPKINKKLNLKKKFQPFKKENKNKKQQLPLLNVMWKIF